MSGAVLAVLTSGGAAAAAAIIAAFVKWAGDRQSARDQLAHDAIGWWRDVAESRTKDLEALRDEMRVRMEELRDEFNHRQQEMEIRLNRSTAVLAEALLYIRDLRKDHPNPPPLPEQLNAFLWDELPYSYDEEPDHE